jgi:mono/diheme cytochrome c family protein
MKLRFAQGCLLVSGFLITSAVAKITPEQAKELPAPVAHKIDFTKEIKPIIEKSCANCHGHGRSKGDFRVDNGETFRKGGDSGSPIVPGKSAESLLIELVMGFDPDAVMPKKGSKLKPEQIALLRAWIDQGAVWDKDVWLGKVEAQNLHVRTAPLPKVKAANPIDGLMENYFKTNKIKWPTLVDDRTFARRVYLDIIGLLPPANELETFVADGFRNKREQLVDKLLSQNRAYAEHWLTFWNDLLRNDYKGTGYIDGGRKQITKWLFHSLETNKPYDQFVAELINPNSESEGFTKGIVWRGTVNASQIPPMQAAQSISQVFMGLNMKCASCHDSFVNDWQLSDAYALANIYSDQPLEIFQCDKPTGKNAGTKFLYPEFGEVNSTNKAIRLQQLASCVTSPKNGRLSRTLVNRLWGRFFGHAFVEPVDDMEKAGWNQDILDWVAEDFVAHKYDVRHLIKQIVTSRAYQLPAVNVGENETAYVFRGPAVRRLTAEQFRDALTTLTGIGYSTPLAEVDPSESEQQRFGLKPIPKWIWNSTNAATKAKAEHVYFRKTVSLPELPTDAKALVLADNIFTLFINGQKVGSGNEFKNAYLYDLRRYLKKGENVFAAEAINNLPDNSDPTPEKAVAGTENPAGFVCFFRLRSGHGKATKTSDFGSDGSWLVSNQKKEGWEKPEFVAENWSKASELGEMTMQPWRVTKAYMASKLASAYGGGVRAALVGADPLMTALGRPNREQVVTTRPTTATTLQALEMTNGGTLSEVLKRGAEILAEDGTSSRALIERIYKQGLGRKPTGDEIKMAQELLGKTVKKEGVEDFLWAMTMLPEFQLIY